MKQHNTIYWFIGILMPLSRGPIGLAQVPRAGQLQYHCCISRFKPAGVRR